MLEANKQALYQFMATHDLLGLDMLNGRITVPTLQALDLVGVRYLTFHTSDAYFLPPVEADGNVIRDASGPWIELPGTFPMIFAEQVVSFSTASAGDPVLGYRDQFEAEDVSHDRAPLHYRQKAGEYMHRLVALMGPSLDKPVAERFILRAPVTEDLDLPWPGFLERDIVLCRRAEGCGGFHHQQARFHQDSLRLVPLAHHSIGWSQSRGIP